MTNFDFLKREPRFWSFSDLAIEAERLYPVSTSFCAVACRKALEAAVKWTYAADGELSLDSLEGDATLANLLFGAKFRSIVGDYLWRRIDYIRKLGNKGAHNARPLRAEEAAECLESLFLFLDFVAAVYSNVLTGEDRKYSPAVRDGAEPYKNASLMSLAEPPKVDVGKLVDESRAMRAASAELRKERQASAKPQEELLEWKTRKRYIDLALEDAGWVQDRNWIDELAVEGLPTKSGKGFADYALIDSERKPLAVVEAKRTSVNVEAGRQQAKLYADALEAQNGRRPIVFLTNGFEWRIDDGVYPERAVSEIYSLRDLEKLFNLRKQRGKLAGAPIDGKIVDRAYQQEAVRRVCEAFEDEHRRKALLVMATGTGKTRTAMAICDLLSRQYWTKHVLFLADRTALVRQAKHAFGDKLENANVVNLCEDKENLGARYVFSTYQTIAGLVDSATDEAGRLFTPGHFDLLICDEAHRSIYNKYRAIFDYFDAPLLGMTATPKNEIDRNTYDIFDLADGNPTFAYELAEAVEAGYLVDFKTVEMKLKFLEEGIKYDELSDEEKERYEETFADEDGNVPKSIESNALNEWLFNEDTVAKALSLLFDCGLKVDYGTKIGKTIIFAKNHRHAEYIRKIFYKQYPKLTGYAEVIDNRVKFAQNLIDRFSEPDKLPQIAISVDMLDTGIDVPEILNLVFFKKVMSKAKFWQMIGRGTRLCKGLIDGEDKKFFYIFDLCGNFEFFRVNKEGTKGQTVIPIQGRLFTIKAEIALKLQKADYQTPELIAWRKSLVAELAGKVQALNRDNFAVRQALRVVEKYSSEKAFETLTKEDIRVFRGDLARLIEAEQDADPKALRFDGLLYAVEAAALEGKKHMGGLKEIRGKAEELTKHENIPEVHKRSELLDKIVHTDWLTVSTVDDFEHIRQELRDLIKYIPKERAKFDVNFTDEILSVEEHDSDLGSISLEGYKAKAERYLREHRQTNPVVAKLYGNIPLSPDDVEELEKLLWSELGSKEDYEKEYGEKNLGAFVREIVGLDMNAAQEAFKKFLNDSRLNSRQIYFINAIVKHIARNGMLTDLSILLETPFTDQGDIADLFENDQSLFTEIKEAIERINGNALGA